MLTNVAPNAATGRSAKLHITDMAASAGYTAGGCTVANVTCTQSSGTLKLVGDDCVWLGSGGAALGTLQYAVLVNCSTSVVTSALIGYWDYGSSIAVNAGETLTVDLDQTNGILTIA